MLGSSVSAGGPFNEQPSWKWGEALRPRGWMLCPHNKLLLLLRLSVDLVWFTGVGGCLMETGHLPPMLYPLGGATGRERGQCD